MLAAHIKTHVINNVFLFVIPPHPLHTQALMAHKQARKVEEEKMALAKLEWQKASKQKVRRKKEELSGDFKHISIEMENLTRRLEAAKESLQEAEEAVDGQLRVMGQVPMRARDADFKSGPGGSRRASVPAELGRPSRLEGRGARDEERPGRQRASVRYPIDDDDLLLEERGKGSVQNVPAPDLLDDEKQRYLIDEMAVSEFLLWFADMDHVNVPALKLRDLHDALVTRDSETLCQLMLSLTLAALPVIGDKIITSNRWRLLCDDFTWPEVLRRLICARHSMKLESDQAKDAAGLLGEMDPMALGRQALLVLLRSLTDAVLEQDPIKGLLDRRHDEAEHLAKDRAAMELEDRRKRRGGGRWGHRGGESEEDDYYDSDNDQLASLREEEDMRVAVRTSPLGEDRHKRRYWWGLGGHAGPLYVEMIDGSWGQVTTKQRLDAIIKSLNVKGIRELQLKQTLEAKYHQIVQGMNRSQGDFDRDDQCTMPSLRLPKIAPKPPPVRTQVQPLAPAAPACRRLLKATQDRTCHQRPCLLSLPPRTLTQSAPLPPLSSSPVRPAPAAPTRWGGAGGAGRPP